MKVSGIPDRVTGTARQAWHGALRRVRRWFPGDSGTPTAEERELLASLGVEATSPGFVRSRTVIDTGGWSGRRWICALPEGGGLLIFAPGPRPFVRRIDRDDIRLPQYHHGIAELLLGVPGLSGLRLPIHRSCALLEPLNLQPVNP